MSVNFYKHKVKKIVKNNTFVFFAGSINIQYRVHQLLMATKFEIKTNG